MTTSIARTRKWAGKLLRPQSGLRWHDECDPGEKCVQCSGRLVWITMRTADGREIEVVLTPEEADTYADEIKWQAEMARELAR
ncbi:hypothetical protein ACWDUL_21105 [Nocardia niigatensis]